MDTSLAAYAHTIFAAQCAFVYCYGDDWRVLEANPTFFQLFPLHQGESFYSWLCEYKGSQSGHTCSQSSLQQLPLMLHAQPYTLSWFPVDASVLSAKHPSIGQASCRLCMVQPCTSGSLAAKLEDILNSISDGVWIIDSNGITLHINAALCQIASLRAEDVVGKHVSVPMKDGKFTSCITLAALEGRESITLFDDYATGKRCLNTSTPIFDENGEVSLVVALIRDMSELEDLQCKLAEAEKELRFYKKKLNQCSNCEDKDFIGNSRELRNSLKELEKTSKVSSTVLLLGETGTGKTHAAAYIHYKSQRAKHPFVSVNCAAIPHTLLESELFGYEKGAYTGADQAGKKGFFELANHGTLLLDEVGDLPLTMQAKLLHVLDNLTFRRIGGVKEIKVDVRILAATNKDLEELVAAGTFRADLYYRIRVLTVRIPPLREHPADIVPLALQFLSDACQRHGTQKFFDPKVLRAFSAYSWPGNVRELQATVEFLAAMAEVSIIKLRDLPAQFVGGYFAAEEGEHNLKDAMEALEFRLIQKAIHKTGSTRKAAKLLGINQSSVVRKAKKLNIPLGGVASADE